MIAFVPVRKGSKSIKSKNIKEINGKPLLTWTLDKLESIDKIDKTVVASDCEVINSIIKESKYEKTEIYDRDPINARDESSTESVILEYIKSAELNEDEVIILCQVTSPLTSVDDYLRGLKLYESGAYESILSCSKFLRFIWNKNGESLNYDYKSRPRRQDFQGSLIENGAFYINTVGNIISSSNRLSGRIGIVEMAENTSLELDEPEDWQIIENIMRSQENHYQTKKIKLFVSDLDGVLTDGGMYYSEDGNEFKKFNTKDGMGFEILRDLNISTAIITSENCAINTKRCDKIKVDYLRQGVKRGKKLEVLKKLCQLEKINLSEVAYIGDDINCSDILEQCEISACPSDAEDSIKNINNIKVLKRAGGEGCAREFINYLIDKNYINSERTN